LKKNESIAQKTVRTSFWGGIEKVSTMGIQFVVSVVLARLLSPSDYGVIAMLGVFISISEQFVNSGFRNALIRKENCTSADYSTAFYFNLVVGLICYCILFVCAPAIAGFYNMEILCPVIRIYSLTIPLGALTIVQSAILRRNLQAEKAAIIHLCCTIVSGTTGITMALRGFGVWALVYQQISNTIMSVILFWVLSKWHPVFEFSRQSMKYLWGFGSKMLLTGIISSLYANIYSIVIGKRYDSASLGIFNRGQKFARIFPDISESVFVSNSLPIISQVQDDHARMIHVYREFVKLACFITIPGVFLVGLLAEPFVSVVLTDKWIASVPYIQLFSLTALFFPANSVNLNLLQAFGRSDYTLRAEVIKKSVGLIAVFSLLPFGPWVLALGSCTIDIMSMSINLLYAKKLSHLSIRTQIIDILPYLTSGIVMGCIVVGCCRLLNDDIAKIIIGGFVGIVSYYGITRFAFKDGLYAKIHELMTSR